MSNKTLFDLYLEKARNIGNQKIVDMIESFSPFKELVNYLGENPTEKDLIDFYNEFEKD